MKKIIFVFIATTILTLTVKSQIHPSTVGLRTSVGNYGIGPELSYQYGLGDINRVEVGLGIGLDNNFDRFGITGAFHWAFDVESGFSWYGGPGIQGWLYSFNKGINTNAQFINNGSGIGAAVGAHIGVEYDFNKELDLPFSASLDSRPMFNFVDYYSGFEFALGLSIRYTF